MNRRVVIHAAVALLLAATISLSLIVPSLAANSCTPKDLFNALKNTVGAATSSACAQACSNGAGCGGVVAVTAVLSGVATDAGQGKVDQFCNEVHKTLDKVTSGSGKAKSILNLLKKIAPSLSQTLQKKLAQALSTVSSPLNVAECSCAVENGGNQVSADLGSCIEGALCTIDKAVFSDPCKCIPSAPIQADCTPHDCGYNLIEHPLSPQDLAACQGKNTLIIDTDPGYQQARTIKSPAGTYVGLGGDSSDANGHCSHVRYCFCPKPMVPTWTTDYTIDASDTHTKIFSCNCPSGTHSAPGGPVNGLPVCICDNTNQVAQFNNPLGMCLPPPCPKGQKKIGGKCVTPCSDPTKGMTADGSCCDPAHMTSCGMCCPPGTTPDPASGTCKSPPVIK